MSVFFFISYILLIHFLFFFFGTGSNCLFIGSLCLVIWSWSSWRITPGASYYTAIPYCCFAHIYLTHNRLTAVLIFTLYINIKWKSHLSRWFSIYSCVSITAYNFLKKKKKNITKFHSLTFKSWNHIICNIDYTHIHLQILIYK